MDYKLEIINNKKVMINLNEQDMELKEIQRNRLNIDTFETKFIFNFKDKVKFSEIGEPLLKSSFNTFKLLSSDGEVVFIKEDINPLKVSMFSNQTETEINMHIVFFEDLEV